jgi:TRAP-type mannitol/chloroaromatic compound transport system permease large subunit
VISREIMGPLMFGGLIVFMLIGYPVAFSLAAVGLFFGFIGIELGFFEMSLLQALPDRVSAGLRWCPSTTAWPPSSPGWRPGSR